MYDLTYVFNSKTREELAEFIRALACAIDPDLICYANFPFMISITGHSDAGKSLFWDEIVSALLENTAQIDPKKSMDLATKDRIFETWAGQHITTEEDLAIFTINLASLYFDMEDKDGLRKKIVKLNPDGQKDLNPIEQFGNIIIANNYALNSGNLHITLSRAGKIRQDSWERKTEITILDPELTKSDDFMTLLEEYCSPA